MARQPSFVGGCLFLSSRILSFRNSYLNPGLIELDGNIAQELRPSYAFPNAAIHFVGPICQLMTQSILEMNKWFPNISTKGLIMGSIDHLESIFQWQEERPKKHTCSNQPYKKWVKSQILQFLKTQLKYLGLLALVNISIVYKKIDWAFLGALVAFWNSSLTNFNYTKDTC